MSLGVSRTLSVCVGVGVVVAVLRCLSGSNSCTAANFSGPPPEALLGLQTSMKDLDCDRGKKVPLSLRSRTRLKQSEHQGDS